MNFNRRHFVGMTAAAVAGMSLFDLARARAEGTPGPQQEYAWFPMGIQSYSLRGYKVDEALDHVQKLGLHHVEFFSGHMPLNANDEQIGAMLKKLRVKEIQANAHGVNGFSKNHDANRKVFEFCNKMGIRNLAADPDPDSFDSLDKLVAEYGIRICIHNHGPGHRYNKIADCQKAVKDRHPWVGFCADLGHFIRSGEDPVQVIEQLNSRVFGIHFKDFAEAKGNAKGAILGKGVMDVAAVFKALRKIKFPADGALSLEYEENPKDPIAEIQECLKAAREGAAKAFGMGG